MVWQHGVRGFSHPIYELYATKPGLAELYKYFLYLEADQDNPCLPAELTHYHPVLLLA